MSREADTPDICHCNGYRSTARVTIILAGNSGNFFKPPACLGDTSSETLLHHSFSLSSTDLKHIWTKSFEIKLNKRSVCCPPAMVVEEFYEINTHANCQRLIVSCWTSEGSDETMVPSFCCHPFSVANALTFRGRGEVQSLRMLRTQNNVLYPPIIHGSLRPPVSSNLKVWKTVGTPARMTFFLFAEMGLEMCDIYL